MNDLRRVVGSVLIFFGMGFIGSGLIGNFLPMLFCPVVIYIWLYLTQPRRTGLKLPKFNFHNLTTKFNSISIFLVVVMHLGVAYIAIPPGPYFDSWRAVVFFVSFPIHMGSIILIALVREPRKKQKKIQTRKKYRFFHLQYWIGEF